MTSNTDRNNNNNNSNSNDNNNATNNNDKIKTEHRRRRNHRCHPRGAAVAGGHSGLGALALRSSSEGHRFLGGSVVLGVQLSSCLSGLHLTHCGF